METMLIAVAAAASEFSVIEKLAVQIPDLVALIIIVILFLRNQEKRDLLIRELHTEHIDSRKESRACIEANTKIIGAILEDMKAFGAAVERCTLHSEGSGSSSRKRS